VNRLDDPAIGAIVVNYRDITGHCVPAGLRETLSLLNATFESRPKVFWSSTWRAASSVFNRIFAELVADPRLDPRGQG